MAALLLPSRFNQQPPSPKVDRSNALGAKVIESLPLAGGKTALVSGALITYGASGSTLVTTKGRGLRGQGASGARASVPLDLSKYNVITLAFWLYWDAYANDDAFAMEFTANTNSTAGAFYVDPNSGAAGGTFAIVANGSGANGSGGVYPRPSAGAWHRCAITLDIRNQASTFYVDGVGQPFTISTGPTTGSAFANSTLNLFSRAGTGLFGIGTMQDLTIYNGALSANEIAQDFANPWQIYVGPERRLWSLAALSTVSGTLAVSEGSDTATGSGSIASTSVSGALARSEGVDTLASSGAVSSASLTGSLNQSEGADTATGSGAVASTTVTGTLARSEGADTATGAGTLTFATITATGAVSEGADTAQASGAIGNAAMGTLARQEGADTLTASGAVAYPAITASLARQETPDSLVASGSLLFAITGMMAAIELPDTLKASSPAPAAPKLNLYTIMRDSAVNLSAPLGGSVNLAGSISSPITNVYTIMRDTSINLTAPLGVSINLTGKLL